MTPVKTTVGDSPIVLGQPHGGTWLPDAALQRLNSRGRELADTDWHINQLYDGLLPGATVVEATFHRYLIDANRDPKGASLYPGQNTTTLCPTTDFDGQDIWLPGQMPQANEIAERRAQYHAPYHAALAEQLDRAKSKHGTAILFDCHSIRSHIPFLFPGQLPDFNIGTNNGVTCHPAIEQAIRRVAKTASGYSHVVNGRFKGGWTTRHYGQPDIGIHAIQLELAQSTYMDEVAPWAYRFAKADGLRQHLRDMLHSISELALTGALAPLKGDTSA